MISRQRLIFLGLGLGLAAATGACGSDSTPDQPKDNTTASSSSSSAGTGGSSSTGGSGSGGYGGLSSADPADVPIDGVSQDQVTAFFHGDTLFDDVLFPADGLGPLYTRNSCGGCHASGERGPGIVTKMVVVEADGITPSADQSKLPFGFTVHPLLVAPAVTPVEPPMNDPSIKISYRVGPPIIGRGYMEAVLDSEIERMETEQAKRSDGIHGHANHLEYKSEANPDQTFNKNQKGDMVIGRFGLKARIATLDEFVADALQGDMGITSVLRPTEIPNPDGLTDDALKPGVDFTADSVNDRAMYMRLTAIPKRGDSAAGKALFSQVKCDVCHQPTLKTDPNYAIDLLAGIDAPIYTDMLVHDMGDDLADGQVEGEATGTEWRTPALIALRFDKEYLHDGRAMTIEDAILAHAGEAQGSVDLFNALSDSDRQTLLTFVSGL